LKFCLILFVSLPVISIAQAKDEKIRKYALVIAETKLAPAGKMVKALTINGGIPGPTLYFKVGETAVITVKNTLKKEETSVHWHGLLLPNAQDGVPYLTTPVKPGNDSTPEG